MSYNRRLTTLGGHSHKQYVCSGPIAVIVIVCALIVLFVKAIIHLF